MEASVKRPHWIHPARAAGGRWEDHEERMNKC